MNRRLLCFLGWHSWASRLIRNEDAGDYWTPFTCKRCGDVL